MKYKFMRNVKTGEKFAILVSTGEKFTENNEVYKKALKSRKAYINRKERENVYDCIGLTKCRTETGSVFWE